MTPDDEPELPSPSAVATAGGADRRGDGSSTAPGGKARARYQRRRREVIEAAIRLFSEKGYDATSLLDIAEAVGLLKGSLYYYAPSKEDLLYAIIEEVHAEGIAAAEATAAATGTPDDKLRAFLERGIAYVLTHRAEAQIYFHDHRALSAERRDRLRPQRRLYDQALRDLIDEGRRQGAFRAEVDPSVASPALIGSINWVAMAGPGIVPADAAAFDRFVRAYADLLVHSVIAPSAPTR